MPARAALAVVSVASVVIAVLSGCAATRVVVPTEYVESVRSAGQQCRGISADVLAAQIEQESGWDATAESAQGAQGIAQFMPETWGRWGRDLDSDGRADPFDAAEAIDAQARLMCFLLEEARNSDVPGDHLELALAAYNAGLGPVLEYGGVPPYPETQEYVKRIMRNKDAVNLSGG